MAEAAIVLKLIIEGVNRTMKAFNEAKRGMSMLNKLGKAGLAVTDKENKYRDIATGQYVGMTDAVSRLKIVEAGTFSAISKNLAYKNKLAQAGMVLNEGTNEILNKGTSNVVRTVDAVKRVNTAQVALNKNLQKGKGLWGQWLGLGLSLLFVGQALKKTFGTWLKTMYSEFIEIVGRTTEFTQKMGRLNAAWTFLKFQIMDAAGQSTLLMGFIEWAIKLFDWISALSPKTREWILILMIGGFLLGVIMAFAGQLLLFTVAIAGAAKIGMIPAFFVLAEIFALLIFTTYVLWSIWSSDLPKAMKAVLSALFLVVLGAIYLNLAMAPILVVVGFILLVTIAIYKIWESDLPTVLKKVISILLLIAGGVGTIAGLISIGVIPAASAMGVAFTAALGPIGLIAMAIIGIILLVWTFRDEILLVLLKVRLKILEWITSSQPLLNLFTFILNKLVDTFNMVKRIIAAVTKTTFKPIDLFSVEDVERAAQSAIRKTRSEIEKLQEKIDEKAKGNAAFAPDMTKIPDTPAGIAEMIGKESTSTSKALEGVSLDLDKLLNQGDITSILNSAIGNVKMNELIKQDEVTDIMNNALNNVSAEDFLSNINIDGAMKGIDIGTIAGNAGDTFIFENLEISVDTIFNEEEIAEQVRVAQDLQAGEAGRKAGG